MGKNASYKLAFCFLPGGIALLQGCLGNASLDPDGGSPHPDGGPSTDASSVDSGCTRDRGHCRPDAGYPEDASIGFPDGGYPDDAGEWFPDAGWQDDAEIWYPDGGYPDDGGIWYPDGGWPYDAGDWDAGYPGDGGTSFPCGPGNECPSGYYCLASVSGIPIDGCIELPLVCEWNPTCACLTTFSECPKGNFGVTCSDDGAGGVWIACP
jgi:hypothetical protein